MKIDPALSSAMVTWTENRKFDVTRPREHQVGKFSIVDGRFEVAGLAASFDARFLIPDSWAINDRRCLVCEPVNRGRSFIVDDLSGQPGGTQKPPRFLLNRGLAVLALGWQSELLSETGLLRCRSVRDVESQSEVEEEYHFLFSETCAYFHLYDEDVIPTTTDQVDIQSICLDCWVPDERMFTNLPRAAWDVASRDAKAFLAVRIFQRLPTGSVVRARYRRRKTPAVSARGIISILDALRRWHVNPMGAAPRELVLCGFSLSARLLRSTLESGHGSALRDLSTGIFLHGAGNRRLDLTPDLGRQSSGLMPAVAVPSSEMRKDDGIAKHASDPRIFLTNTSTEYWFADAALELAKGENLRHYFIGNASHSAAAASAFGRSLLLRPDVIDYFPFLRALLLRLIDWSCDGRSPPPSRYPTLTSRAAALGQINGSRINLEALARVLVPVGAGECFRDLVPQMDDQGVETGGIRMPDAAGYYGWNCIVSGSTTYRPVFGFGGRASRPGTRHSNKQRELEALFEEGFLQEEDLSTLLMFERG